MASEGQAFDRLVEVIRKQQQLINSIANKLEQLESIGGGGSASIEDYVSGTKYKRNVLVVDTDTETVYRVLKEYTSTTVESDCENGYLKLVGFESQIVTMNHDPSQSEINALPDDSLVVVYSSADTPYQPIETGTTSTE